MWIFQFSFILFILFLQKTKRSLFNPKDGELKLKEKSDNAIEFDSNIDDEHDVCKFNLRFYCEQRFFIFLFLIFLYQDAVGDFHSKDFIKQK